MSLFNLERRETLFQGIHNPFESPTVPLTSLALDSIYSALHRSESGETVTPETALSVPAFWRCVGLLATVIAGCPLYVERIKDRERVTTSALDPENPYTTYTQFELFELMIVHELCWGNSYVRKVRDTPSYRGTLGPVEDLIPVNPERVRPFLKNGRKLFEIKPVDDEGRVIDLISPRDFNTEDILHIPAMGSDGLTGMSPIMQFARTIGTAISGDKLAASFFSKGSALSGIINVKAPLTGQDQADAIRQRWMQKSGGVGHAAEVAVLDAETSFQPLTIAPDALQFLESRRWETTEIARWHGIPPHLVGDVERSTSWGEGIEAQNVGFVEYTISGWTKRFQQRLTREIVSTRGQRAFFDLSHLMRGTQEERFTSYQKAVGRPWMTVNEARAREHDDPIAGGDVLISPLNMVSGNPPTAEQELQSGMKQNEPDNEADQDEGDSGK